MTKEQWKKIVATSKEKLPERFSIYYDALKRKLKPRFKSKYHGVTSLPFDGIYNEKVNLIFTRIVNDTLKADHPSRYIERAIDNFYRDELRKKKTTKGQAEKGTISLDEMQIADTGVLNEAEEKFARLERQAIEAEIKKVILSQLDEEDKKIFEGILAGKKDKEIKKEIDYNKTASAFSQKKSKIIQIFRTALFDYIADKLLPKLKEEEKIVFEGILAGKKDKKIRRELAESREEKNKEAANDEELALTLAEIKIKLFKLVRTALFNRSNPFF